MNVVYKMTNQTRLANNTPPFYYIGSKNNCEYVDGLIIDKYGKPYFSSTKSVVLKEHLKSDVFTFEILLKKDETDVTDINHYERDEQLKVPIKIWNSEYYNKAYAISGFTTNGFANYHYGDNKIVSLPINHPDVLSGKAIAQQKGRIVGEKEREILRKRIHASKTMNWSEKLKGHKKIKKYNYKKPKSNTHKKNIAISKMKPVQMLDKNMNHINYYDSIDSASIDNNIHRASIGSCCNGKIKTSGGFIWRFV